MNDFVGAYWQDNICFLWGPQSLWKRVNGQVLSLMEMACVLLLPAELFWYKWALMVNLLVAVDIAQFTKIQFKDLNFSRRCIWVLEGH